MTLSPRELAARRRMFRRRRALALLSLAVVVVLAAVLVPRIAASAADAEVRKELDTLNATTDAALAVSSPIVTVEASAALATARDAARAAGDTDEQRADAALQLATAVSAFAAAAADGVLTLLGDFSDAERSTEDALYATIPALQDATPELLPDALTASSAAATAVQASAQAYRDGIIAAAQGASAQPTGGSVDAQLDYLLAHADAANYNTAQWGDYNSAGGDCVNFASQGLYARGWQMDDEWFSGGAWEASKAWRSTTAIDEYLAAQGFAISTMDDLDRVRVGDVGVFDWAESGVGLDHTMTVSRVTYSPDGPVIQFASHNNDGQYRDMPATLTKDPGSTMRIYSIP